MARERMFHIDGKVVETWNPFVGCLHECSYCWARRMAKRLQCADCKIFFPHMHYERLKQKFQGGKVYFVCDMGDISNCPKQNRELILDVAAMNRDSIFLFCTKKPSIYLDWREYPENLILGATIETDMEIVKGYSSAPSPTNRFTALHMLRETEPEVKIALAIEPILEFSDDFEKQIDKIEPNIIWIGYDNYKHKLKEPPLPKTMKLTENLEAKGYTVYRKTLRKAWYEK